MVLGCFGYFENNAVSLLRQLDLYVPSQQPSLGFRYGAAIMEDQMEKKMHNEVEAVYM